MDEAKMVRVFRDKQRAYRRDPVLFARDVIGYEPDQWQADTLLDLADPTCRRVSVRSGQGVGKTATEAVALMWFLSCFPYARVVATEPTSRQLNDVLWSEIAKWQGESPLLSAILKWTKTYVYMVGMEKLWFATARTATKPENMQGFHEENMLFIVDEAIIIDCLLDFLPYSVIMEAAGVRLPAASLGLGSGSLVRGGRYPFYLLMVIASSFLTSSSRSLQLRASSSSWSLSASRASFSMTSAAFAISSTSSLPFLRAVQLCLTLTIIKDFLKMSSLFLKKTEKN